MSMSARGLSGSGYKPRPNCPPQHTSQRYCPVLRLDLADGLPSECSPGVTHGDPLYRRVEMGVDPELAPELECLPRIRAEKLRHDVVRHLSLNLLVNGSEEVLFAVEVVVEGTFGHFGLSHDLVERGVGEAPGPEDLASSAHQRGTGRRALGQPANSPLDKRTLV